MTPAQVGAVLAAVEDGRASAAEGEQLLGFLMLRRWRRQPERTERRRRARLLELGIPEPSPADLFAVELATMLEAGEITAEEAEVRAGRFLLSQVEVDAARQ